MVTPGGRRILVIENDPDIRFLLSARLAQAGHVVEIADDAAAALRHCSLQPPPELLLVHLGLPDMPGFDVVDQIRALEGYRRIPVIFISSQISSADSARAEAIGAYCLSKPFATTALLNRIDTVLAA